MPANSIAEALRKMRISAGLQGKDLAKMVDISRPYLSQIETGIRVPSRPLLNRLAYALGVSPDEILWHGADHATAGTVETLPPKKTFHGETFTGQGHGSDAATVGAAASGPCPGCVAKDAEIAYLRGVVSDQAATMRAMSEGVCRYPRGETPAPADAGPTTRGRHPLSRAG